MLSVAVLLAGRCFGQDGAGPANSPSQPAVVLRLQAAVASGTAQPQPIPDLHIVLVGVGASGNQQAMAITDGQGKATTSVLPGNYRLFTPRAVHVDRNWYTWDLDLSVPAASAQVQLSEHNAIVVETNADGTTTTVLSIHPPLDKTTGNPARATPQAVNAPPPIQSPVNTEASSGTEPTREGQNLTEKPKALAGYDRVIVTSISVPANADTPELGGPDSELLDQVLVSKLRNSKLFPDVRDASDDYGKEAEVKAAAASAKTLALQGTLLAFRKGDRRKRGLGVFGAGLTRMEVRFTFRDAKTGRLVLAVDSEGTGEGGLLSGGDDEQNARQAVRNVVKNLLATIREHR